MTDPPVSEANVMDRIYVIEPKQLENDEPEQKWEYHEWKVEGRDD